VNNHYHSGNLWFFFFGQSLPLTNIMKTNEEIGAVPFERQIAGHGALLKLPENRVAKPLIERELWFYNTLKENSHLLPFTIPCHGTMEVEFTKEKITEWMGQVQEAQTRVNGNKENTKVEFDGKEVSINPWSLKVTNSNLGALLKKNMLVKKYLIMEDATAKYKEPCVCDLKIGTRQHGDDAAPDKKRRHTAKCENTTSKTSGLRLCGQMVYEPESEKYRHFDKYQGRAVTEDTLKPTIAKFLDNGMVFRKDVLYQYITTLKKLLEVVQSDAMTCHYRFYSTSLLLLYEGDMNHNTPADLKMIDFAHTFPYEKGDCLDDGYLFGLNKFLTILEEIALEHK